MSNFVAIQNKAMPVFEYQDKRVVTFAMIDKVHGRPKGTAKSAFIRHRSRFVEKRHFFELSGDIICTQLLAGLFPKHTRKGMLITEMGYLLLVKPFQDDLAWGIQEELVTVYFRRNTLGELRHVEIPSLEELREMPAEKAPHIVAKAEKESSYGHGKPGSAAMTLLRKELKQIRPAIRTLIDLHQISICDLGDFIKWKNNT